MSAWLKRQLETRRWLTIAVAVYLALTAVELARIAAFGRPPVDAAGVYPWELAPASTGHPHSVPTGDDRGTGGEGAPAAPAELGAFATSSDQIQLTWDDVSEDETGFKMQRMSPEGGWVTTWIGRNRTTHSDPVDPGSSYCYRLRSYNASGYSVYVYSHPNCVVAENPLPFRWTSRSARLFEPLRTAIVTIPIYLARPDVADAGVELTVSVAERRLDRVWLRTNGWHRLSYYLPILLDDDARPAAASGGGSSVVDDEAWPVAARGAGSSVTASEAVFHELHPWTQPPGPPSVWFTFDVGTTIVPAVDLGASNDHRELGIGLGQLQWSAQLPLQGIGFHEWEAFVDGRRFRWTRRQASQPLAVKGAEAVFSLRADHPDIERQPVNVRVFWNTEQVGQLNLADRSWTDVAVAIGEPTGAEGVLSVRIDRTWLPADAGLSSDLRTLGVAMTEVSWRR